LDFVVDFLSMDRDVSWGLDAHFDSVAIGPDDFDNHSSVDDQALSDFSRKY